MEINLVPDSSISSAPAGLTAAVQAAANVFDEDFPGDYTINISYGWGTFDNVPYAPLTDPNSGDFSVGGPVDSEYVNYAQLKGWLTDHATSSDQKTAVASLPASNTAFPGGADTFYVSSAEEKALGVFTGSSGVIDGSIGFDVGDASDSYYWETGALVEIAHALGWDTAYYTGAPSIADLFRYSSPGNYQWTGGQPAYFSINGGHTPLANFSTTFDYSLFSNVAANDPFNVNGDTNPARALTSLDIEVLNAIGFDVTPTVSVGVNNTVLTIAHDTATVTFAFSEAPKIFSLSDVKAVGGKLSALKEVNATTYTATFTGAANTDINNAVVSVTAGSWQDADGNPGAGSSTHAFVVDTVTPTVSVGVNNTDLTLAHNTATVTFAFSEAPTTFSLSDVTALGGTLSALKKVNATTYTATFTGAVNTDINNAFVKVTAGSWKEVDGNPGAAGGTTAFTVDTVTPTVSVGVNNTVLTLARDTATVTFTFSEAPTAFSLSDVTAVGGALSALKKVNATTYTATFTGAVNTDINNAVVKVTAGSWKEVNGNPGAAGGTTAFTVNTMDHWIKSVNAEWGTAADWGNAVPTASVGADVDASGTYEVSIASAAAAYGLTLNDAGATVTDNSGGTLTLDGTGGSSSPNGVWRINSGLFALNGGALHAGSISIASSGHLSVSLGAYTGSNAISEAIVDNGSIVINDGRAVAISGGINGTGSIIVESKASATFAGAVAGSETVTVENTAHAVFDAPIAGTGSFVVMNGGSLEFGAADSESVTFATSSTGALKVDHSLTAPFIGTIAGLTQHNMVDLADLTWVKGQMHATFSGNSAGGVLTVTDGSHSVGLKLSGNYTSSTWALSNDGSGGTEIVDPLVYDSSAIHNVGHVGDATLNSTGAFTNDGSVNYADDYDLLVGAIRGTGDFSLSDRSTPEFGAGVSSRQTVMLGADAADKLNLDSASSFSGMIDDFFTKGDAIANTLAESARTLLSTQTGADSSWTLTDGANTAALNLAGERYVTSDFSIVSANHGGGSAIKFI